MAEGEKDWNLSKTKSVLKASKQLRKVATKSKLSVLTKTLSREFSLVRILDYIKPSLGQNMHANPVIRGIRFLGLGI